MTSKSGVLAVLIFGLVSCSGKQKANSVPEGDWQGKMQQLSVSLGDLFPLLVSERQFNDPSNFSKIEKNAKKLLQLTHEIGGEVERGSVAAMDADPSVRLYSGLIKKELATGIEALENGQRGYARVVLRNAGELCVKCHTRGNWGPEFSTWADNSQLTYLSDIERAELLTAVRRYDLAIAIYQRILANRDTAQNSVFAWERAAKGALNLSLRVKGDLKLANEILDTVLANPKVALFIRRDAAEWKNSLGILEKMSQRKFKDNLEFSRELLKQAAKSDGYWMDLASKYVLYLKVSGLLHDHLRTKLSQAQQAETFYLLGKSYEAIQEPGQANLNELYFKACIMSYPHTKQSVACFDSFEESIFMSYLREGGLGLSQSTQDYLEYLRGLSTP